MSRTKKWLSIAMIFAIILNTLSIGVSSVLGDGSKLSVDINLEVGTYDGDTWTPLAAGATLKANDVITVRICPENDFLCGASSYAVMFSKSSFQVIGNDSLAFTPNDDNAFFYQVAYGYIGFTSLTSDNWPAALVDNGDFNKYTAVVVSNMANSNSRNEGHPDYLPGDWLFRFNLLVTKDITIGSNARIWMDSRWVRNPDNIHAVAYFVKCDDPNQLSSSGIAKNYYKLDLTGADITLPTPAVTSTITFDSAGGSAVNSITGNVGGPVTAPTPPAKTGYTFACWNPVLPAIYPAGGLHTTAQWAVKKTTITFNSLSGSSVAPITADYNSEVTAPPAPDRNGFQFDGWFYDSALAQPVTWPLIMPADTITLFAKWTYIRHYNTITFDSNGGTEVDPITGWESGTELFEPDEPKKEGYIFNGWFYDNETFLYEFEWPYIVPDIDADLTLYAKWTPVRVTVNFNSNGGTDVTSITGCFGDSIEKPSAPARVGSYNFAGWYLNEELTDAVTWPYYLGATNVTFFAKWEVAYYSYSFDDGVGGSGRLRAGETIPSPTIVPRTGYTFAGWSPDVPAIMPAHDVSFMSLWSVNSYTITFDADGGTGGTSGLLKYGSAITIPKVTRDGYTFDGWSQEIPDSVPAADVTFYAKWTKIPVTLNAKNGSTAEFDSGSQIIYGIEEGMTTSSFIKNCINISGDGSLIIIPYFHDSFGTGTKIELIDNETGLAVASYNIVIYGDVDGDGYVTAADDNKINMIASYQTAFDDDSAFENAADINRDGIIDSFDLNIIRAAANGIGTIDQTNPGKLI